jgi:hypothetical protein
MEILGVVPARDDAEQLLDLTYLEREDPLLEALDAEEAEAILSLVVSKCFSLMRASAGRPSMRLWTICQCFMIDGTPLSAFPKSASIFAMSVFTLAQPFSAP